LVFDYRYLHDGQNLSDHCPIFISIAIYNVQQTTNTTKRYRQKAQWNKATEANICEYRETINSLLSKIKLPLEALYCKDFHCSQHKNSINVYCDKLIQACTDASDKCIPRTRKKGLAGWNDVAQPLRDEAMFWHNMWVSCGRPNDGVVVDIRRRTRAKYKQMVKQLKRDQINISRNKMASSLQEPNKRDFWNEIKRQNGKRNSFVNTVDGENGEGNISQLFASNYKELYNSVSYNVNDMQNILDVVDNGIIDCCSTGKCRVPHHIEVTDVKSAINKLKCNKADGVTNLMSDALLNSPLSLTTHLSLLFSACIIHGFTPENMLLSTLIPIPKSNTKSRSDSSNYRAIALGSLFVKILDNIVMVNCDYVFKSSDLQFGFKPGHSTTQCSFVIEEIIEYYNSHNSPVFVVTLDASKAFDRVEYTKLFKLLINRGICSAIARLLIYMYTNQKLRVNWNGIFSNSFNVTNGVKQGGILSPLLFCLYIDSLLIRLSNSHTGCHVGNRFVGALCYADDVCLLASTRSSVMKMLSICESYGIDYKVSFNSTKSHITVCNSKATNPIDISNVNFPMYGHNIDIQQRVIHLGRFIGDYQHVSSNIDKSINDLVRSLNYVMSNFGHCSSDVRNFLFQSYCTSFYGSPLWSLGDKYIERFYCTWRKCIRRVWNISHMTHCKYIPLLYGGQNIDVQLLYRFLSFYLTSYRSNNTIVLLCSRLCETSNSTVALNRRKLLMKLNNDGSIFDSKYGMEFIRNKIKGDDTNNINDICYGNVIKEICLIRDGVIHTDIPISMLNILLTDLCNN